MSIAEPTSAGRLPFAGLVVVDAANYVAAPGAATILGDFGATVIKIEPPATGDIYRLLARSPNLPQTDYPYAWAAISRGKQSITVDLKTKEGRAALERIVTGADVFITNQPPSARSRLGISYETLSKLNPRLIYASLTGYGESGAEADKPGFDATAYWARSGLADFVRPDPDKTPAVAAMGMGDQPTAMSLYAAIVTGLYERERTGRGAWVHTSLIANGAWANMPFIQAALTGANVPNRPPRAETGNALTCFYESRDKRWLSILILSEQRDWPLFCQTIDRPELADDGRFSTIEGRRANASQLVTILEATFLEYASEEWSRRFSAASLPVSVAARTNDIVHDQQMLDIGVLVKAPHIPGHGLTVDSPFWINGREKIPPGRPPGIGEHTDDVLRTFGFSQEEINSLRASKALG